MCKRERARGEGGRKGEGRLASSNGDQFALANFDDMVSGDGLCVFGVRVTDKRSDTTPSCQHVSTTNYTTVSKHGHSVRERQRVIVPDIFGLR